MILIAERSVMLFSGSGYFGLAGSKSDGLAALRPKLAGSLARASIEWTWIKRAFESLVDYSSCCGGQLRIKRKYL